MAPESSTIRSVIGGLFIASVAMLVAVVAFGRIHAIHRWLNRLGQIGGSRRSMSPFFPTLIELSDQRGKT
jgi:hypothetical protein